MATCIMRARVLIVNGEGIVELWLPTGITSMQISSELQPKSHALLKALVTNDYVGWFAWVITN